MSDYNFEKIAKQLKSNLSLKRYQHCMRVSINARMVAEYFSYDTKKAKIAGLLHDCAKELPNEEMISLCREHELPLGDKDIKEAHYLHGVAGACLAHEKYHIDDKEILLAIANHSGRPDMSFLEKIIMLCDLYDGCNRRNIEVDHVLEEESLDKVLVKFSGPCLQFCVDKNIYMAERTQDAFDYILTSLLKDKYADKNFDFDIEILSNDSTHNIKRKNTELEEEMFQEAININMEHGLKLKSVKNIRDLGGFVDNDGNKIKKHKILRSASLSSLNKQEAKYLKDYGITTIIDLRTAQEIKKLPDINIDGFRYYNCQLPVLNEDLESFRSRLLERKHQAFSTNEDIWYNVQYFVSFDMIGMYKKILFDKPSLKQIKKVFFIIASSNEKGILFHCASGKDRTGIVSIFLLLFLGIDYTDIRADYYTSSLHGLAETESYIIDLLSEGYGKNIVTETKRVLGVSIDLLPVIKNIIDQKYGSFESYIQKEIGFDAQDIQNLKNKLIHCK